MHNLRTKSNLVHNLEAAPVTLENGDGMDLVQNCALGLQE